MAAPYDDAPTGPLIGGTRTDTELADQLLSPIWTRKSRGWLLAYGITSLGALSLLVFATWTVWTGIGLWGNNIPVAWAFAITNFVWWIGIGHAGTFISAILLLFEQKWRTSINRFAEAMTLFAVMQAGLFPLLHLGRPWFFYWLIPYPAVMQVWPNFKSALPWDCAAVFTYFTISLLFWYTGVIPDLAAVRDRTPKRWQKIVYGVFALGWRGSASHLRHYRIVYGLLAGLATPLVLSVHSVVSSDFAIAQVAGWHSTIFPPYFVAGAIFSGFAMVLTLMIPIRRVFRFENVITDRHVDNVCKLILVTALIVDYSYFCEFFLAWYGGERGEMYTMFHGLPTGPNCWTFWVTMFCNVVVPQLFWFRWFRRHGRVAWVLSLLINVGMWCERFVIIALSLQRGHLPSMWHAYAPTIVDWGILAGTIGLFSLLYVLFLRWVPIVPTSEVRELNHELARERKREAA
ncbi:MAG TPA: NrfD/PsrC family molybdoenzyme membrane anchor subunit [Polyangia bacterium]|jgi:Ni/Fe-hydrogenase subunit HybB-like protein|nr:NrfD/PsrC family molybdoenzyme membrane anchor subunit [Polyangia bacterium]